ncbi:MAG: type II secretion system major pseudopilin GspG [Treponema sp.]|nr:type II secretion system major pseudopilin GspG [Treponema sp.]
MKKRFYLKKEELKRGWTFIETLIVMAIVLVLTVSVGFSASKQLDKAKVVSAQSQISTFCLALDSYYLDNGFYPSESQGLEALWEKPSGSPFPKNWNGPYVSKKITSDPWGNSFLYRTGGRNGNSFSVISLGRNGTEGGEGYDKDISSED